jgi:tetratricopeptide (TPR) repeat protein
MVKQFPDDPKYAVALGASYVRREDHAAAEKILAPLTGHTLGPVRGAAHYQLARSAFRRNDAAKSLKHLQAALLTDSASLASIDALHFKARVHEKLGQVKEAIQALEAVLEADAAGRDALEHLVRLELQAGLKDAALDHLRRFTVAAGKDLSSLVKAADLHLQMGRHEEAYELATRARELNFQAKAQRVLGLVHFAKQEYTQAAFHLERCDLDGKALGALIQSHLRLGDLDAARRRAESIRRLEKPDKELLAQEKDVADLVARRDQLLKKWNPAKEQEAAAVRIINRCLCAERGLHERWPRTEIDKLVHDAGGEGLEYAPLFALRGLLMLEKGQLRKAIADADAAIELQVNEARAHLVRGRARLEQGNVNAALSDLRKATEFSKREDATVLHWLAAALLEAGRTKEAVETQRLALLLRPNDAELQEQLRRMEVERKPAEPASSGTKNDGTDGKQLAIPWRTDYSATLKEAKEKRLPVLILFVKPNSAPSEKLDREMAKHADLIRCLNSRMIPLRLNFGNEKTANLAEDLNVLAYPTMIIADREGKIHQTLVGYHEPSDLLERLTFALNRIQTRK